MTGRLLVFMAVMTALAGPMAAGPGFAQAPVQLYPRSAPAVPPPSQEPARPVTQPMPQPMPPQPALPPAVSPPAVSPPAVSPPVASPPAAPRGIAVTPLPPAQPAPPPIQPAPIQPAPGQAPPRDDVLAVVEGFYAALGRGDGQLANEFLVPEKRNQGAYEIASMTRFYSAMSEPLRVVGLGRLDPLVVRVQYTYAHRSGRRCDGVADVTVHRVGGRALIDRVRALSGC